MSPDGISNSFIPSLDVAHVDFHLNQSNSQKMGCHERKLSDVINSRSPSALWNSENSIKKKSVKKKETSYEKDSLSVTEGLADCKDVQGPMQPSDPPARAAGSLPHPSPKWQPPMGFSQFLRAPMLEGKDGSFLTLIQLAGLKTLLSQRKRIIGHCWYPSNLCADQETKAAIPRLLPSLQKQRRTMSLDLMNHNPFSSPPHGPVESETVISKERRWLFKDWWWSPFPAINACKRKSRVESPMFGYYSVCLEDSLSCSRRGSRLELSALPSFCTRAMHNFSPVKRNLPDYSN